MCSLLFSNFWILYPDTQALFFFNACVWSTGSSVNKMQMFKTVHSPDAGWVEEVSTVWLIYEQCWLHRWALSRPLKGTDVLSAKMFGKSGSSSSGLHLISVLLLTKPYTLWRRGVSPLLIWVFLGSGGRHLTRVTRASHTLKPCSGLINRHIILWSKETQFWAFCLNGYQKRMVLFTGGPEKWWASEVVQW